MPPLKWKIFLSILVTLIAFAFSLPNFKSVKSNSWWPDKGVNFGLDLRGGSHLLLDVEFETYIDELLENLADNIRKSFKDEKIGYKDLKVENGVIKFTARDQQDISNIKKHINKIDRNLSIDNKQNKIELKYGNSQRERLLDKIVEQSIEIIRNRVDSTGTKEPIIQTQGQKHILLQVPGEENPQNLKNIIGKTAKLTFHIVDNNASITDAIKGNIPTGSILLFEKNHDGSEHPVVIKKKILLSGDQLNNAQASFDQNSSAAVNFSFNNIGGKLFGEITKNNTGKRLAIVLDNKVISAPTINTPILGGSGIITGNFTVESANELALLLRAGALPAPLKIIEERTVGPNLGADSIESGKKAGIIGFIAVVIFMIWSYGILGLFAAIALSCALLYILALLSMFQATLTLPGIAGIILTIGMAVDANVLIYERIKEELIKGSSNLYAIRKGFEAAFATIADSNITTLIAALLLYIFGIGAIKGFAVTLTIGVVSSMFAAIIITKLLIDLWMRYYKPRSLYLL